MSYIEKCVLLTGGLEVSFSILKEKLATNHYKSNNHRRVKIRGMFEMYCLFLSGDF